MSVGLFDCSFCAVKEGCAGRDGIEVDVDRLGVGKSYNPGGNMRLCGLGLDGGEHADVVRDEPEICVCDDELPDVPVGTLCDTVEALKILVHASRSSLSMVPFRIASHA